VTPMTHIWLYNPATEAYWNAPAGMVERLKAGGWEDRGAPAPPNPATDEHTAWREAEAARKTAADKAAADEAAAQDALAGEPVEAEKPAKHKGAKSDG
jgi:hypothetical protein